MKEDKEATIQRPSATKRAVMEVQGPVANTIQTMYRRKADAERMLAIKKKRTIVDREETEEIETIFPTQATARLWVREEPTTGAVAKTARKERLHPVRPDQTSRRTS